MKYLAKALIAFWAIPFFAILLDIWLTVVFDTTLLAWTEQRSLCALAYLFVTFVLFVLYNVLKEE